MSDLFVDYEKETVIYNESDLGVDKSAEYSYYPVVDIPNVPKKWSIFEIFKTSGNVQR